MKKATLIRKPSTDEGTAGEFVLDDGWTCASIELPDRGNINRFSRIPNGIYTCHHILSPTHGWCYQVMNVPNRSMIEIHSANFAGDVQKGYVSQLLGCIALGSSIGHLDAGGGEQMAVLHSRDTVAEFERRMGGKDFELTIKEAV